VCVSLSGCVFVYVFVCLCVCMSVYVCVCVFVYVSVYMSTSVCVSVCVYAMLRVSIVALCLPCARARLPAWRLGFVAVFFSGGSCLWLEESCRLW
jgi:hypothetical protein